jgi:hypothetical protein
MTRGGSFERRILLRKRESDEENVDAPTVDGMVSLQHRLLGSR